MPRLTRIDSLILTFFILPVDFLSEVDKFFHPVLISSFFFFLGGVYLIRSCNKNEKHVLLM